LNLHIFCHFRQGDFLDKIFAACYPLFRCNERRYTVFRIFLKLKALEKSGELIQLGAEGARPLLKLLRLNLSGKRTESIAPCRFFRPHFFSLLFFRLSIFCWIGSFLFFAFSTLQYKESIMASSFETTLFPIVQTINEYLSNYVLVILLLGIGIWYTIKTRCVQVRCFKEGWNRVFGNITLNGKKGGDGMSSFQALATAIAAQVGTGIIVGVAGAILTGGPGAVFWMWVISFFGMATIYAEATLAQETRIVEIDGTIKGGPVYYITTAFKGKFGKFLAGFFAVAITLALGFMGCMVQSNSIGATMETAFGIPSWVVGIVLIVICAFIFLGGVQRLASVTEKVVPLMAAVFLFGGLIVLVVRIKYIPETFAMIFRYAFEPQAIVGGGFGYAIKLAISQGAKRGLFSNEAGMGSTPHAHALANVKNPHEQGTVAIIGVFIDMFVILTLNALVIISTLYAGDGPLAGCGAAALSSTFNKTNLAQCAFGTVFGYKAGSMFVAICLFFFAFSTILSWNLFGKINMVYLFGKKSANVYTLLALIFIFLGTTMSNDLVWELSDMLNQLMVIPNAIALLALTSHVVKHSHTPDRLSGRENG
jgi:AGCS family alanine or glycine:cation symporter